MYRKFLWYMARHNWTVCFRKHQKRITLCWCKFSQNRTARGTCVRTGVPAENNNKSADRSIIDARTKSTYYQLQSCTDAMPASEARAGAKRTNRIKITGWTIQIRQMQAGSNLARDRMCNASWLCHSHAYIERTTSVACVDACSHERGTPCFVHVGHVRARLEQNKHFWIFGIFKLERLGGR
jgi:hypothetical protein